MKTTIATAAILIATPAFADPGHYAQLNGHSHWLAAGALVLAAVVGAAAFWRTRNSVNRPAKAPEQDA